MSSIASSSVCRKKKEETPWNTFKIVQIFQMKAFPAILCCDCHSAVWPVRVVAEAPSPGVQNSLGKNTLSLLIQLCWEKMIKDDKRTSHPQPLAISWASHSALAIHWLPFCMEEGPRPFHQSWSSIPKKDHKSLPSPLASCPSRVGPFWWCDLVWRKDA